jgi:glycosyltransferase involved in cell wall biosynthesis
LTSLSIVVPAYNEQKRLPSTLELILAYIGTREFAFVEVLVVDDGSTDATGDVARQYARQHCVVKLISNPGNRGKGYAVRHGMTEAKGEWILYTDADLSAPIDECEKLLNAAEGNSAEVCIGSRALDRSLIQVHQHQFREYSGRAFNLLMRIVTGLPFCDTQCGFKLYSSRAAKIIFPRQQLDGFSFDVEDLYIAKRHGIKTVEVPVRWSNVEGTKVSLTAGLKSFADLLKIRRYDLAGKYR